MLKIESFMHNNITSGSWIFMDDHSEYFGTDSVLYENDSIKYKLDEYVSVQIHTNDVESLRSDL